MINAAHGLQYGTCSIEIDKNEEEILKIRVFSRYLIRYEMHEFLSLVFYSHALSENRVLQKGSKFTYFWPKIQELHVLLNVSHPLVTNNFSGVEIHGFHLQKT